MHRFHGLHYLCVYKFTSPFQLSLWEEQAVPKALADLRSELALGACPLPSPAVRKTDIPSHQAYSLAGKAASGQGMKSRMRVTGRAKAISLWSCWLWQVAGDGNTGGDCTRVLGVLGCTDKLLTPRCLRASMSFHSCPSEILPTEVFFADFSDENDVLF